MTCSEDRLIAFVSGELSEPDRARFDEHLLGCEACWRALQEDHLGRLALDQLTTPPPGGLADRIRLSIELAGEPAGAPPETSGALSRLGPRRAARRRAGGRAPGRSRPGPARRRIVAVAASVVLAAGIGIPLAALGGSVAGDPPAVAAVVSMASRESAPGVHLPGRHAERLMLGGQAVMIRSFRTGDVVTLVATSMRPFAMPPPSHVVAGSSPRAWMATRGSIGLYCVNAPPGHASTLAAAPMPAVELPGMLERLRLGSR